MINKAVTLIFLCVFQMYSEVNYGENNGLLKKSEFTGKIIHLPVADFTSRITKKKFGQFITPETSPVQPERFRGFHTGVDVEYDDIDFDIPLYAVSDGTIIFSGYVNGYGGVVILEVYFRNSFYLFLYGHMRLDSLAEKGKRVLMGEEIGILGSGYSRDTANERKHLHLSVLKGREIDFRGYTSGEEELLKWIDPLIFYK